MTILWELSDGGSQMRVWDFNGDELDSSPVQNADAGITTDSQGIPISPDLRAACQAHLDGSYQPSAYTQQFLAEITLGDVEQGVP